VAYLIKSRECISEFGPGTHAAKETDSCTPKGRPNTCEPGDGLRCSRLFALLQQMVDGSEEGAGNLAGNRPAAGLSTSLLSAVRHLPNDLQLRADAAVLWPTPQIAQSVQRAVLVAKREAVFFPLNKAFSLPHRIDGYWGAAKVMLRPAADGAGVIAGE